MRANKSDVLLSTTLNKQKVKIFFTKQGLIIAFLILIIIFSLFSDVFLTERNIKLVLRQVSIQGIMACGMTVMLISGNLDLSVGSIVSFAAYLIVDLYEKIGMWQAVIITLLVGLVFGCINGFFVGILNLNSLIVTIGMLSIIQAITLLYSKGSYIIIKNPSEQAFAFLGRGFLGGIPFPVIVFLFIVIFFYILMTKTKYAIYIYALGGNKKAVKFSGIREDLLTCSVFIITSLTATLGGIIFASRNMAAQTAVGSGLELEVIAAVVLGGTSLLGGSGNVIKSVIGVLILGFLYNAFILFGLPYYTTQIVQWGVIIAAVWLDIIGKRFEFEL
ncbi:ribose ABC transporter permease [Candidatus Atribacteria bacterium HGW-Atribacteria-1]|nr:MAG: ribose ABC transporter permease [Candidatus Atribacteria bacterium HGW-Atribacteria-1]